MSLHAFARALEEAAARRYPGTVWSIEVPEGAEDRARAAVNNLYAKPEGNLRSTSAAPATSTPDSHNLNEAA